MRGNGARDGELFAGVEAKAFSDAARETRAPLALLAQNFKAWRLAKLNAGLERVDGETDRSELSAEIPVEIEKTQMQARRRRDLNALQLRASSPLISSPPAPISEFVGNFARLCAVCQAPRERNRATPAGPAAIGGDLARIRGGDGDRNRMLPPPDQNATVAR